MRYKWPPLAATLALALTIGARGAVLYVDVSSTNPAPPYTNWSTAAVTIQDAVDASIDGDEVVVSNGVYQTGGSVGVGTTTNRVAVTNAITIRSVNGPGATVIEGYQVPGTTNGDEAVRCVYLGDAAVLSGFTLTNGATGWGSYDSPDGLGGGVACGSLGSVVTNCVLTGNSGSTGGGAYLGTFYDCTLTGNSADWGGGAYSSTLNHCTLTGNSALFLQGDGGGGGAYYAVLNNCTLSGNSAAAYGGAVSYATLNNCTLTANSAWGGGAAYYGTLNNCVLAGNSAPFGGGALSATLNNCTLTANVAGVGGGALSSTLNNCIAWDNRAGCDPNYSDSTLNYSCTTPLPGSGANNIEADPQLASASHLSWGSPCRGAGSAAYVSGTDIDGEPWAEQPSMGCDELQAPGSATGPLSVDIEAAYTNIAAGFLLELTASIGGNVTGSRWEFGDGTVVSNRPYASHAWAVPGDYAVVLRAFNDSNPGGVSATLPVQVVTQSVHYVSLTSTAPAAPYGSWATAATNIQDAVDVENAAGALVLVSNGVYAAGGRAVVGSMTNRLTVAIPLEVRSVNGPRVTTIQGNQSGESNDDAGVVRCACLAGGSTLSGFTLTEGGTRQSGDPLQEQSGGGVWCASTSVVVSNCILGGNTARVFGGGGYSGTYVNCKLLGNVDNWEGGGVHGGILYNCSLAGNYGGAYGGGAFAGTLNNCTVTDNSSMGGAVYDATLNNCILYSNNGANYTASTLNYCCATPMPTNGIGNFTNDPVFVDLADANARLQSSSPCINAGANAWVFGATDLDGRPRIVGGTVDLGAYEFQPGTSSAFLGWLDWYGLPTDGSADYADSDGDSMNNWQEWLAGTNPTNAASVLQLQTPIVTPAGLVLQWCSDTNRFYSVELAAQLGESPTFSILCSNIPGQTGTTMFTDTNAVASSPRFYRVRVEN